MPKRLLLLLLGVLVAVAVMAPGAFAAKLRVGHSIPDFGAVDVYVNGNKTLSNLGTLEFTDYLDLDPGTYNVEIRPAGAAASSAPALAGPITLDGDLRYTAVAQGLVANGTAGLALEEDRRWAPFKGKRSALRVWHNSPDAPNVDVVVNGDVVLSDVPFGTASDYLVVPADTYSVQVNVAGTNTAVFGPADITLKKGEAYTAIAKGSVGGTGAAFMVDVLKDADAGALVRAFHAIPDFGKVSIFFNDEQVVASLKSLAATGYLRLDAGNYNIDVSPRGQSAANAALTADVELKNGKRYTAVAKGLVAEGTAGLALQSDIKQAPAKNGALRVWHLSPDAPNVDVYVNGKRVLKDVPFEAASKYFHLKKGKYNVKINVAGSEVTVFAGNIWQKNGLAKTAAAVGAVEADGRPFQVKILKDATAILG